MTRRHLLLQVGPYCSRTQPCGEHAGCEDICAEPRYTCTGKLIELRVVCAYRIGHIHNNNSCDQF